MSEPLRRRTFLKNTIAVGTGLAIDACSREAAAAVLQGPPPPIKAARIENVRIGLVGVGRRGSSLVRQLLRIQDANKDPRRNRLIRHFLAIKETRQ